MISDYSSMCFNEGPRYLCKAECYLDEYRTNKYDSGQSDGINAESSMAAKTDRAQPNSPPALGPCGGRECRKS